MTYSPSVRAMAFGMGYKTCPPCVEAGDDDPKGPVHRNSGQLWDDRLGRARAHDGIDPASGVTADFAEAHLALVAHPAKLPGRTTASCEKRS
jgi:hypothetical protein